MVGRQQALTGWVTRGRSHKASQIVGWKAFSIHFGVTPGVAGKEGEIKDEQKQKLRRRMKSTKRDHPRNSKRLPKYKDKIAIHFVSSPR